MRYCSEHSSRREGGEGTGQPHRDLRPFLLGHSSLRGWATVWVTRGDGGSQGGVSEEVTGTSWRVASRKMSFRSPLSAVRRRNCRGRNSSSQDGGGLEVVCGGRGGWPKPGDQQRNWRREVASRADFRGAAGQTRWRWARKEKRVFA